MDYLQQSHHHSFLFLGHKISHTSQATHTTHSTKSSHSAHAAKATHAHITHSSHVPSFFVLRFGPGLCYRPLHVLVALLVHFLHHVHDRVAGIRFLVLLFLFELQYIC